MFNAFEFVIPLHDNVVKYVCPLTLCFIYLLVIYLLIYQNHVLFM